MRIAGLEQSKDEDLLNAFARDGDRDALEVLLRRHESRVYGLAYRILGERQDALDATQDVFLLMFRKARSFRGDSALTTWLYRLTVNACHDVGRKRARAPRPSERLEESSGAPMESADDSIDVHDALRRLPKDQRTTLVMREIYGLSYEEIAMTTRVPVGTVKSRIARGRTALAGLLAPEDERREPGEPPGRLTDQR